MDNIRGDTVNNCSELCDIFSYGQELWEMLTGEIPFKGLASMYAASMYVIVGRGETCNTH